MKILRAFQPSKALGGAQRLDTGELRALKQRLVRQRVLHLALDPVERGILHLCCRLNLQAKSSALISALSSIFRKASLWLSPSFRTKAMLAGRPLAVVGQRAAMLMGNRSAAFWSEDEGYVLLLGVNALNGGG